MSTVPYFIRNARWGIGIRNTELIDGMWEGLTNIGIGVGMGLTAENLAEKYGISRESQDEVAYLSQMKAVNAIKEGRFKDEIIPVSVPIGKGQTKSIDTDEHPRADTTLEKLAKLKPAFKEGGTVTAGNASGINDGAAAMIVMSEDKALALGIKPMARIVSYAVAGVDPDYMGYGPVPATQKALAKGGLSLKDIELMEINEAFAAQYLAVERGLGLNRDLVNVNGGGIALGHPIGATGTRIIVTLIHEMQRRSLTLGLASLCAGGGMGMSVIVERV